MMNMYYKWKGRNALRGNWQTAMVVAFFSGIFMVLTQVYQNRFMPVAIEMIDGMYYWRVPQITRGVWIGFAVLQLCSVLLTPVLSVGCNHYFVRRIEGEELGAKGLFSRMNLTGKALWLYVMMFVKILLWTCLLIVPGFIAAIRYSMAPYLLAEHPDWTAKEALEESKRIMKGRKGAVFPAAAQLYRLDAGVQPAADKPDEHNWRCGDRGGSVCKLLGQHLCERLRGCFLQSRFGGRRRAEGAAGLGTHRAEHAEWRPLLRQSLGRPE